MDSASFCYLLYPVIYMYSTSALAMLILRAAAPMIACFSLLSSVRYCEAVIVPFASCDAATPEIFFLIPISSSSRPAASRKRGDLRHPDGKHALQRFLRGTLFQIKQLLLKGQRFSLIAVFVPVEDIPFDTCSQ